MHLENIQETMSTSPIGLDKPGLEDIEVDFIESRENFQGNYSNYVSSAIRSIVPLTRVNYSSILESQKLLLPEATKKTLILDLDETLIHADFERQYVDHDHLITFLHGDEEVTVPIFLRPGLFEFLEKMSQNFEIFIFTASKKVYADAVLNFLDPDNRIFKFRFYRENCIKIGNKVYIKDLRIFVNRKPENIIMVDNSLYSFANQISNGVLINSFYDDNEDRELLNLCNYLENYLRESADVRLINEKIFNFSSMLDDFKENYI
jgi:Dullard-like phosphatase family protein